MFRPARSWATRADIEAARDEVLRVIADAERSVGLERSAWNASRRRWAKAKAIVAGVILLMSGAGSLALVGAATQQLPLLADPGRIGVAVVEADDRARAMEVNATFDAASGRGTAFTISVSDWESGADQPLSVAVYFCGAIRHGLHLQEMNSDGELRLKKLEQSTIILDSFLGLHEDCRYVIAEGGFPRQVMIAGKSTSNARVAAAASIAFAFPGLTTILTEEPVGSATAWRLDRDSRISVAIGNSPADLKISTAQPQVPQSGTLRWNNAISPLTGLPSQYRISGSLQQQETIVQSQLFVAGALVGVAGAAFLWCVELLLDLPRRRRTAGLGASRRAAP